MYKQAVFFKSNWDSISHQTPLFVAFIFVRPGNIGFITHCNVKHFENNFGIWNGDKICLIKWKPHCDRWIMQSTTWKTAISFVVCQTGVWKKSWLVLRLYEAPLSLLVSLLKIKKILIFLPLIIELSFHGPKLHCSS